jgi:opacity protein-like surface antigen
MPILYSRKLLSHTALVLSWLVMAPALARAEFFGDLYGGATLPEHAAASHTQTQPTAANLTRQLDFGAGPTFGLRVGYWFARFPWLGVAGDLSYFSRSAEGASISAVPISLLLMLRLPLLVSEEHPTGKLQPYIGFGPSFVAGNSSIDVAPLTKTQDGSFTALGADAKAGLLWKFHRHIGVFGEYRFTYFSADTFDEQCPPPPQPCRAVPRDAIIVNATDTSLTTHHILIGFRFSLP